MDWKNNFNALPNSAEIVTERFNVTPKRGRGLSIIFPITQVVWDKHGKSVYHVDSKNHRKLIRREEQ